MQHARRHEHPGDRPIRDLDHVGDQIRRRRRAQVDHAELRHADPADHHFVTTAVQPHPAQHVRDGMLQREVLHRRHQRAPIGTIHLGDRAAIVVELMKRELQHPRDRAREHRNGPAGVHVGVGAA